MDRDEAYELVQAHSLAASDSDSDFRELIRADARVTARISANELSDLFDYGYFLRFTDAIFGTNRAGRTAGKVSPRKRPLQNTLSHRERVAVKENREFGVGH